MAAKQPDFANILAPWHMWGTSQRLVLDGGDIQSRQLVKIAYKRPETWSMFFGAKVIAAANSGGAPTLNLEVDFEVIIGVGRTMFDTNGGLPLATAGNNVFRYFNFILPLPYNFSTFGIKYATSASGPPVDDALPLVRQTIDWFPAQDIQVRAGARATPSAQSTAIIEVTAWCAPRSHVRPDWFADDRAAQFLGGERGGT